MRGIVVCMILEREGAEKKNNTRFAVGYDLGNSVSQISYSYFGAKEPETISTVAGGESYNIPTVLAKRLNVNQWFYGKEAYKAAEEGEGVLVEKLLELARSSESVTIDGNSFEPAAMLALFMKRTMSLFTMVAPIDRIEVFVVTVDELDREMIDILNRAVAGIGLKTEHIYFQSHMESFYYYTIFQPKELWKYQVLLYDFGGAFMKIYRMECNRRTTPVVAFIESRTYETMYPEEFPEEEEARRQAMEKMDSRFMAIVEETLKNYIVSSAYLIGEGFKENWMEESLKLLCKKRRVFQGNNLYSKGACYSGMEKVNPSENGKAYVFLGNDKLKANIGMRVLRQGEDSYLALLDAGINWFDAKKECEVLLESGSEISLLVTPLNGKQIQEVVLHMDGLLERPERTTRLHMRIYMNGEHKVLVELKDLGFGELFTSSGQVWEEEFEV